MNKNRYNFNENEYEQIIKLLKELPKEKAADNFEYNLMVKIKNGNFENVKTKKENFAVWKILIPAGGLLAVLIVLFTFFNFHQESADNPFRLPPQLRTEISGNVNVPLSSTKEIFGEYKITDKDVVLIESKKNIKKRHEPQIKKRPKHLHLQGIAALPFKLKNSTNLDEAVKIKETGNNINHRAALTGMNNAGSGFDGFFIGREIDKKEIETMKARIDSIKKLFLRKHK